MTLFYLKNSPLFWKSDLVTQIILCHRSRRERALLILRNTLKGHGSSLFCTRILQNQSLFLCNVPLCLTFVWVSKSTVHCLCRMKRKIKDFNLFPVQCKTVFIKVAQCPHFVHNKTCLNLVRFKSTSLIILFYFFFIIK